MRCQRRADLGGRRGLGATRMTIIALVVLRTAYAALIGAVLGVVVMGGIITGRMDALPPVDFVIGVGILSVIAALVSTLPPAVYAAHRDPVGVLRTP